jgi:predicted nucleic acid-binding protein
MSVFVDTSAFLAVLNETDSRHRQARQIWAELVEVERELITTNYVILETISLVQRRLGMSTLHEFLANTVPFLGVEWVTEQLHQESIKILLTANRRQLSLVDCVSFVTMRQSNLNTAFAFDKHFREQGFTIL